MSRYADGRAFFFFLKKRAGLYKAHQLAHELFSEAFAHQAIFTRQVLGHHYVHQKIPLLLRQDVTQLLISTQTLLRAWQMCLIYSKYPASEQLTAAKQRTLKTTPVLTD